MKYDRLMKPIDPKARRYDEHIARNLRSLCKGAFGNLGKEEYNRRINGTKAVAK